MWLHPATRRNVQQLIEDGVRVIEPAEGEMACGEHGPGRLAEPQEIMNGIGDLLR
jgi:phosphopantothenoylcysteine decarboxylase/phosphopantothenate--cysteine ligase